MSRTFHGDERGARRALDRLFDAHGHRDVTEQSATVDALFDEWLAAPGRGGRPRAASSTYQERRRYERHVRPVLGKAAPNRVRTVDLNRLYDRLIAGGLSPTSVRRVHQLLSAMFSWAVSRGLADSNPAVGARPPSAPTAQPSAPELHVIDALLDAAAEVDRELLLVIRLGAVSAARRSELVALRWNHVDLDAGAVTIEAGEVVVPGAERGAPRRVTTSTKTNEAGTLSLDDETVALLVAHRERQDEAAGACGAVIPDDAYVFAATVDGSRAWHPDTFSARMERLSATVPGADDVTLKSLRAFTASELEASGADLTTAQAVLRHRSSQTTARHYRAARDARVRSATRGLGERLGKKRD